MRNVFYLFEDTQIVTYLLVVKRDGCDIHFQSLSCETCLTSQALNSCPCNSLFRPSSFFSSKDEPF